MNDLSLFVSAVCVGEMDSRVDMRTSSVMSAWDTIGAGDT